jgi:hypothetical protein
MLRKLVNRLIRRSYARKIQHPLPLPPAAEPERKTEASPAAFFFRSISQQKIFLFLLAEKIRRAKKFSIKE